MTLLDASERTGWRLSWLGSIQEFADEEVQRESWLNLHNSNPHHSFVELMCTYFDGLGFSDEGYSRFQAERLLTADERAAVTPFHDLADAYAPPTDDYDHAAILDDPHWARVVESARMAQTALLPLLSEEAEREALMMRSSHARQAMRQG